MWVIIDNYDSFSWILHHYLLETGNDCRVIRNDEYTIAQIAAMHPDRIILSPGPETPLQAGVTMDALSYFHDKIPILGVCLGHQAIGIFFGAQLKHAPVPMHGKTSLIRHKGHPLFKGLPNPFKAMRYHSLVIEDWEGTGLRMEAFSEEDACSMVLIHERFPCMGIQFHPESIGTEEGQLLLKNWAGLH